MIVFHSFPIVEKLTSLMQTGQLSYKSIYCFTLNGYLQQGRYLMRLHPDTNYIPSECMMNMRDSGFDAYYWKQLEESLPSVYDLMEVLSIEFEQGPTCIICISISQNEAVMAHTESFIRFLNHKYGLECSLMINPEDVYDPDMYEYHPMSRNGIHILSQQVYWWEHEKKLGGDGRIER